MKTMRRRAASFITAVFLALSCLMFTSVTQVSAESNEETIFSFLVAQCGLNKAAACGVLANIEKESNFRNDVIEWGYTWESGGGYGICQWTGDRRTNLVNWCSSNGYDYKSLIGQLYFLKHELEMNVRAGVYSYILSVSDDADGAFYAGKKWCYSFETPAGYNTGVSEERGELARSVYWPKYGHPVEYEKDTAYNTPLYAYPAITSGVLTVYNSSLSAYSTSSANIAWNDLCTINEVYTNGYCKVTYPTSSGNRTEYAKITDFVPNKVSAYNYSAPSEMTAYMRSNMGDVFGSVFKGDPCKVVGKSGSKLQLIYPVSGGYKLGWVSAPAEPQPSDFPKPLYGYNASPSARTTVYESTSSMGTYYGEIFVDDYCTLEAVNVKNKWIQVTYPISNGTKTGYVYLNDFVPDSTRLTTFYRTGVTSQTTTYRKSDMATEFGWVSVGDEITVVGKSGNKLQVLYPLDAGGYKIAWIYDTYVKKTLSKIAVTSNPKKTSYIEGENLDKNGLVVTAYYEDGSTANVTSSCQLSGYDSKVGSKTVKVTYGGKETAFSVNVVSKSLTGISITSKPTKMTYTVGESIDTAGLKVQAKYNNNTVDQDVDYSLLYDKDITGTVGTKAITVSYSFNGISKTAEFSVLVSECKHQFSSSTVREASCGTSGIRKYTCSICSYSYSEEVPATNEHSFSEWSSDSAAGMQVRTCSVCGKSEMRQLSEERHIPGDVNSDGKVTMKDYSVLQQYLSDWPVIIDLPSADVDGSGNINMKDYSILQRYLSDWPVELKASPLEDDSGNYTKMVYGYSESGRPLECYVFAPNGFERTVLLNFAIHGYEDEYDADAQVLVDTANELIDYYDQNGANLGSTRLVIIPCANPDGLLDGTTNNGFGRCNAKGIDLNRDFDANYKSFTSSRNYTQQPFSASESRAMRDLVCKLTPDVTIDFHGWENCTIGNYNIAQVFLEEMGLAHNVDFSTVNASGYFANWAYQQGSAGLLVEFTNSHSVSLPKLKNAINRLLNGQYEMLEKDERFAEFNKLNSFTLSLDNVTTYKFIDEPYSTSSYIAGRDDNCIIHEVYSNGWLKVQYPITNGSKVAYAKLSDFIPEETLKQSFIQVSISENTDVYKRSDLTEKYGTVCATDKAYVVSETNTAQQIIYELDSGGWKMGWIIK